MNKNILTIFKKCKSKKRPAILTYTVAGDNTINRSLKIIESLAKVADLIELGFPHNTPIADGGQIQESSHRALTKGIKLQDVFKITKNFKKKNKFTPLILMGYYNLVYQLGENKFINKCKHAGVDGLIIVDLPWPENKPFSKKCKRKGLTFVQLLSPTTSIFRMKKIIRDSHEMMYYISMLSTTGGKLKISPKIIMNNYKKIKRYCPNKNVVIGFGITDKSIHNFKKADGVVIGSQLCKTITNSIKARQNPVTKLSIMMDKLKRKLN